MTISGEQRGEFFRIFNQKYGKCLEPHMQCGNPAIRAHSIQNRQIIELLEKDGHVFSWQPRVLEDGPEVKLRLIGRNEASTFTGFCNEHDTELFRPLDTKPLDATDREQLLLLAYRAISYELFAVLQAGLKLQVAYNSRIESGIDTPDASSPAGMMAVQQMFLGWLIWRYRFDCYDKSLLSENYADIEHDVIVLDVMAPCLAVSSFIMVKEPDASNDICAVAINILPASATKTLAIFSYAPRDRGAVRTSLDRILTTSGDLQKYEMSKLILSRISNVLISPRHFETWGDEKKRKITEAFLSTVMTKQDVGDDVDLMLF